MLEQIISQTKQKMTIVIDKVGEELAKVRTGSASTDLLEGALVEYYGTPTPLKQVATLSTPQPNLIVVQPWDKGLLGTIENAIRKADLGFSLSNDGQVVRVSIPQMTQEDREKFVKVIHEKAEAGKIALRNLRKDAREEIEKLEKSGTVTEDDKKRGDDRLNKLIEDFNTQIDKSSSNKEKEVMTI